MTQKLFISVIIFSLFSLVSCSNKTNTAQTAEEKAEKQTDSLVAVDNEDIQIFLNNKIYKGTFDGISLNSTVHEIKEKFRIKLNATGSATPIIAHGYVAGKRMTWELSMVFDEPFGTSETAHPHKMTLGIALCDHGSQRVDSLALGVAKFFDVQLNTYKPYEGNWVCVSNDLKNIYITISDKKEAVTSAEEEKDSNTFDFTGKN